MALPRDRWWFCVRSRSSSSPSLWSSFRHRQTLPPETFIDVHPDALHDGLDRGIASNSRFLMDDDIYITMRDIMSRRNAESEIRHSERADIAEVFRNCHKVVYKSKSLLCRKAKLETQQTECPVCLEKLAAKDKLFLLPCNHWFHIDCLTPWINRNNRCCPLCRADIVKKTNKSSTNRGIYSWPRSINLPSGLRSFSIRTGRNRGRRSDNGSDGWDGLQQYIFAALADMDNELNRLMH